MSAISSLSCLPGKTLLPHYSARPRPQAAAQQWMALIFKPGTLSLASLRLASPVATLVPTDRSHLGNPVKTTSAPGLRLECNKLLPPATGHQRPPVSSGSTSEAHVVRVVGQQDFVVALVSVVQVHGLLPPLQGHTLHPAGRQAGQTRSWAGEGAGVRVGTDSSWAGFGLGKNA